MSEQLCHNMTDPGTLPDNAGKPLIEMRAIYKIFQTGAGDFTALNGVDVCFYEGEFVSVVGQRKVHLGQYAHRHRPPDLGQCQGRRYPHPPIE
jgi:hypothetical protein